MYYSLAMTHQRDIAYIHTILSGETLDVEVGRSLVFKRFVDYSVILLFISSTQGSWNRTYLGEFTSPSRPLPLEISIILVSIVYILEPSRQLVYQ
jgi:hypothetical protein